jgi:CoA-transferase family III
VRRFDINRVIPPFAYRQAAVTAQAAFNQWNQGKRSVRPNLEMREAVAIAKSLAVHCDLVVENFAPGVIARMGLGYKVLREIRPEIIMLHCPKCQAWHVPNGLEKVHDLVWRGRRPSNMVAHRLRCGLIGRTGKGRRSGNRLRYGQEQTRQPG